MNGNAIKAIIVTAWIGAAATAMPPQTMQADESFKSDIIATVNGIMIPKLRVDVIVKAQKESPDSEQLRKTIRDRLIEVEILAQEAVKEGLDKNPELQAQRENQQAQLLALAYAQQYIRNHPVSDTDLKAEYNRLSTNNQNKEYRVRHFMTIKEDDAKAIIVKLNNGATFDELASNSLASGIRSSGELGWNTPSSFIKPYADAIAKIEKGKYTKTPVQTSFGWFVIQVDDIRQAKLPELDMTKDLIKQQIEAKKIQMMVDELRKKSKIE
jgi:peptidyl-prolyl cis-trans isomerase C